MKRVILLLLFCSLATAQTVAPKGLILQPSGDATLMNIIIGSAVASDGTFSHTAEVYLVKGDRSAPPRKLTAFDESNHAPGATSVAISPDGTRATYIGLLDTNGVRHEEVHAIDIASGADRLIATNQNACTDTPPCLGPITFSQDGAKLLWGARNGPVSTRNRLIDTANFDGGGQAELGLQVATISGPNNVTTAGGRFIFLSGACGPFCQQSETASLDGSAASVIETASNTLFDGGLADEVTSASGNVTAEVALGSSPSGHVQLFTPKVSPGLCTQGQSEGPMGSITMSSDGSHVAGVNHGQIFNCGSAVSALKQLYAFDVELSGDGSRMIFSAGAGSAARAAVWIADASGANTRPVFPPSLINESGVVGIGSRPGDVLPLSPGSYATIYGASFVDADALTTAGELPFPASLAGVSVDVNGVAIPVQAVTPWQINALLPQEIAPGNATVTVHLPNGTALKQTATVAPMSPAIDLVDLVGSQDPEAAAFHPGTATLADPGHPAVAGEILETYGFGLGPTTPAVGAGAAAPSNPLARAAMPFVNIDGALAQTTFAGLVPGLAGLYQVNVVVPTGLPAGVHLMSWYTFDPAAGQQGWLYTK